MSEQPRTSSIDDILMGAAGNTQQPATPETKIDVPHETIQDETKPSIDSSEDYGLDESFGNSEEPPSNSLPDEPEPKQDLRPTDEYGNPVFKPKKYSEDEVNERINAAVRERLARLERNQPTPQQAQQAAQTGFEYNADSQESWQQQLESFVENTVTKLGQRQAHQAQQAREQESQMAFDAKFQSGMRKFPDYVQIVQSQPITDAMVMAARSMKDPAAFFYAASKRAPQELERIARIADPYAQIAETAKLEERMKKQPAPTKTPRPIAKVQDDVPIKHDTERKGPSIEQLIAESDAKRQAKLNATRRGR